MSIRNIPAAVVCALALGVVGAAPGASRGPARGISAADSLPPSASLFRDEHAVLLGQFARLMKQAVDPRATHTDRAGLVLFMRAMILPHARVEEQVLYPAVDSVLGTKGYATATMVLDHKAIARLVDDLSALAGSPDPEAFRRRAYALDAVLEAHFAKEEQFILPILTQHMSPDALRELFERMGLGGHALVRDAGAGRRA